MSVITIILAIHQLHPYNFELLPVVPFPVQLTCVSIPTTFEQVYASFPLGLFTLMFSTLMLEHADGLEQTM
jgi:hypothetical protein